MEETASVYFVLSTGRAGSRTISNVLDQCPGTVCRHHPEPELAAEATAYYCGDLPRSKVEQVLRETRQATVDGQVYGEVNLQLTLLFPILRDLFPDAKYLWLLRDGRDSVASMYYRHWYDDVYPRHSVKWRRARLHGDRTGDFTPAQWAGMGRFERCCWVWKKYNLLAEEAITGLPEGRGQAVRLDLLGTELLRLCRFLGIGFDPAVRIEQLNVARQPVSYWERWSPNRRRAFEQHCGPEMDRWFPEWRSPLGRWRELAPATIYRPGRAVRLRRDVAAKSLRVKRAVARRVGRMGA